MRARSTRPASARRSSWGAPPARPRRRVTDAHFTELKKYFSEDAIVEIVAVISLLGWLNRWNITLATRLEDEALAFAREHLAPSGWTPGTHEG